MSAREEEEEEESEEETKADDEERRRWLASKISLLDSSQFSNLPLSKTQFVSELNISS